MKEWKKPLLHVDLAICISLVREILFLSRKSRNLATMFMASAAALDSRTCKARSVPIADLHLFNHVFVSGNLTL